MHQPKTSCRTVCHRLWIESVSRSLEDTRSIACLGAGSMNRISVIEWKESAMVVEVEEEPQQAAKKKEQQKRSYWSQDGQVFFTGRYGWGLHLVEMLPNRGQRSYEVKHVCLGREEEVLAILDGESIPNTLTPVQKEVLTKIVDNMENNKRSGRHNDRTEGFSFRKGTRRSFRGDYRHRI